MPGEQSVKSLRMLVARRCFGGGMSRVPVRVGGAAMGRRRGADMIPMRVSADRLAVGRHRGAMRLVADPQPKAECNVHASMQCRMCVGGASSRVFPVFPFDKGCGQPFIRVFTCKVNCGRVVEPAESFADLLPPVTAMRLPNERPCSSLVESPVSSAMVLVEIPLAWFDWAMKVNTCEVSIGIPLGSPVRYPRALNSEQTDRYSQSVRRPNV